MPNLLRTSSYPKVKRFRHRHDLNLEALRKLGEVLPTMALGPRRAPWLIEKDERSYSVAGIDKAILCRLWEGQRGKHTRLFTRDLARLKLVIQLTIAVDYQSRDSSLIARRDNMLNCSISLLSHHNQTSLRNAFLLPRDHGKIHVRSQCRIRHNHVLGPTQLPLLL